MPAGNNCDLTFFAIINNLLVESQSLNVTYFKPGQTPYYKSKENDGALKQPDGQ